LLSAKGFAVPKGAVSCFISVPVVIMVSVTAARVAARSRAVISEAWKAGSTIGTGSASIAAAARFA